MLRFVPLSEIHVRRSQFQARFNKLWIKRNGFLEVTRGERSLVFTTLRQSLDALIKLLLRAGGNVSIDSSRC